MTFSERLVSGWYQPRLNALTALLWPLSHLFGAMVALRRIAYRAGVLRSIQMRVPVIVVGNITVGGTGKTPLTLALASHLAAGGYHPGLVSRGYGGSNVAPRAVVARDDAAIVGDEALLLAASGYPVWIGHRRARVAQALLAAEPACDVVISDDGLQHYALGRTMEIVVFDADRGFGNGCLLPAGPLREPLSRLRDADAIVRLLSGGAPGEPGARETTMTYRALPWRSVVDPGRSGNPSAWRSAEVHAVAGIGNPQRFFAAIKAQGIEARTHAFADHHVFTPRDIAFPGATAVLMTHKDAVKCRTFADDRCWYLPVQAVVAPALIAAVEGKLHGRKTA